MGGGVKKLLADLYPGADLSEGIDFDKSGRLDENEKVKDLNGDGRITDVDYGILSFYNRGRFIDEHGIENWRKLEEMWDRSAKRVNPLFERPPQIGRGNPEYEDVQRRVMNGRFGGKKALTPEEAAGVVEVQKALDALKRKYPNIDTERMTASDAVRIMETLDRIEGFNPNLANAIKGFTSKNMVEHCSDRDTGKFDKFLIKLFIAGCAISDDKTIHLGTFDMGTAVHEAAHVYHFQLQDIQGQRMEEAKERLRRYVHSSMDEGASSNGPVVGNVLEIPGSFLSGHVLDAVNENLAAKGEGRPYDKEMLRLYDEFIRVREGSFDHEWYHVNEDYLRDDMFQEVEAAGREMEAAEGELKKMLVEEFGEGAAEPFWKASFYEGGDRPEAILKGGIVEKIRAKGKNSPAFERLNAAVIKWEGAKNSYLRALDERFLTRTGAVEIDERRIPLVRKDTRSYGLPSTYAHKDPEEAVAEWVRTIYEDGEKAAVKDGGFFGDDERMAQNYIQVLRRHGFIP